ncbi:MAG: hypothetical protein RMM53_07305 [Bacteroidia bacterium]|nr:hypothetical protein [Bacteroidia bacterium]
MWHTIRIVASQIVPEEGLEIRRANKLLKAVDDLAVSGFFWLTRGVGQVPKGKPSHELQNALQIRLVSAESGNFKMYCRPFSQTLGQRPELFDVPDESFWNLTPFGIILQVIASVKRRETEDMDAHVLRPIAGLKSFFRYRDESLVFSNQSASSSVELTLSDAIEIAKIESQIPAPKRIRIVGTLDKIDENASKIAIVTENGKLEGLMSRRTNELPALYGESVEVQGTVHYCASGRVRIIEVERITPAGNAVPGRIPHFLSTEKIVEEQLRHGKLRNPLQQIIGQWPGDEPLDELLQALDDVRR